MFSQLSYKQKTRFLLISGFILFFIGYKLAILPTLDLYRKIEKEVKNIEMAKTAPNIILKSKNKLQELEKKVGQTSPTFELFQKEVLNAVVPFSKKNHIKINEIKSPHIANKNSYEVQTLQIECKANFKNLTLLLNYIQHENIGRVCSVDYELRKDHKLKRHFLFAKFFIQNYKYL